MVCRQIRTSTITYITKALDVEVFMKILMHDKAEFKKEMKSVWKLEFFI